MDRKKLKDKNKRDEGNKRMDFFGNQYFIEGMQGEATQNIQKSNKKKVITFFGNTTYMIMIS